MRPRRALLHAACLFVQARGQLENLFGERAEATASPPTCALTCLAILIPQYCGSLTNTTCICTSAQLTAALEPFALAACNITEALQLEKYSALAIYYVAPPLAFIFVIARIFMRIKLDVGLGPDDWMMVAALCAYLTDVGTGLGITTSGFGQHTFWLSTAQVTKALKFFYISEMFYMLTLTLTKLSRRTTSNK